MLKVHDFAKKEVDFFKESHSFQPKIPLFWLSLPHHSFSSVLSMNPTHTKSDIHLVIVDVQHDFAHPEGALFVPGAEQAVKNIADLLHDPRVTQVTFTLDWHPFDHSSFKAHGGIWPRHCVQFSKGASLHESLWVENFDRLDTHFVRKGQLRDCEEYGAFANPTPEQREWLNQGRLVVCGIAGDYCVLETLKNILRLRPDAEVFTAGVASIDGGTALEAYLSENNIPVFTR